jgi:hypothetical protein
LSGGVDRRRIRKKFFKRPTMTKIRELYERVLYTESQAHEYFARDYQDKTLLGSAEVGDHRIDARLALLMYLGYNDKYARFEHERLKIIVEILEKVESACAE